LSEGTASDSAKEIMKGISVSKSRCLTQNLTRKRKTKQVVKVVVGPRLLKIQRVVRRIQSPAE
jgi:hypothetical protein